MLRRVDCLDARVFRVNAVKAEKGREGREEDVAAACGLRHVTVFLRDPKKVQLKSKKKFDICDKTIILPTVIGAIALHNSKKERKEKNEKREKDSIICYPYVLYIQAAIG